jgi:hypothetical protein
MNVVTYDPVRAEPTRTGVYRFGEALQRAFPISVFVQPLMLDADHELDQDH